MHAPAGTMEPQPPPARDGWYIHWPILMPSQLGRDRSESSKDKGTLVAKELAIQNSNSCDLSPSVSLQTAGVTFTCIVDPDLAVAEGRIQSLRRGEHGDKWAETKAFKTYQEMLDSPVSKLPAVSQG